MKTMTETYCDVCGRRDSWGCGHTGSQRRDARRHNATRAHIEGRCWHYDHRACGAECQPARDRQPRSGWVPLVSHQRIMLEYLRGELRAERISYGELAELQGLAEHIEPGDVELLEAAGVPEFGEENER